MPSLGSSPGSSPGSSLGNQHALALPSPEPATAAAAAAGAFLRGTALPKGYVQREAGQYRLLYLAGQSRPLLAAAADGALYLATPPSCAAPAPERDDVVAWLHRLGYRSTESTLTLRLPVPARASPAPLAPGGDPASFRRWLSPRDRASAGADGDGVWK